MVFKKIILLVCTINLSSLAKASSSSFCQNYQIPSKYTEFKSMVDEKIRVFANKKNIATQADEVLSKLLAAKSPVLNSWLSQRNLKSKAEDDIVREWRLYYARQFILTKYPHANASTDQDIEKLIDSVNQLFANKKFREKMEVLFAKAKDHSLQAVKAMPIKDEPKRKIVARLEGIRLYWMKEFKTSKFKSLPMDFLDWGLAYDPMSNEINIGINSLVYPNDETLLAVFAHEIGHSIDSCRWSAFFDGDWPFQKIGDCLRGSGSVAAKKRDDSQIEKLAHENKELATSLKANPTCNKLDYPPTGRQADQLPESFADWFATEVLAKMQGLQLSTLRIDLCEKKELQSGSSYPSNEFRLNAIYFAHPVLKKVRHDLITSHYSYCGW